MIEELKLRMPEASYHSQEAKIARTAAVEAVENVNARVADYTQSVEQLMQADVSTIDPENVFNGECRLLKFSILQEELQARKLADAFFEMNRRESYDAVQRAAGITCPEGTEANENAACDCWVKNRNRIVHLTQQLRTIVQKSISF